MKKAGKNQQGKISLQLFFTGIIIYLASTLFLITFKIIFWNSMSGWWIFTPPLFVVVVGLLDIMAEAVANRIKPGFQSLGHKIKSDSSIQSAH